MQDTCHKKAPIWREPANAHRLNGHVRTAATLMAIRNRFDRMTIRISWCRTTGAPTCLLYYNGSAPAVFSTQENPLKFSGLTPCGEDEARLTLLYHIIENQTIKALTVFRFVKLHAQVATQHRDL